MITRINLKINHNFIEFLLFEVVHSKVKTYNEKIGLRLHAIV